MSLKCDCSAPTHATNLANSISPLLSAASIDRPSVLDTTSYQGLASLFMRLTGQCAEAGLPR